MQIDEKQIQSKKVIGQLNSHKVFEITTKGGLHLLILGKAAPEVISAGPHTAVSRHIALKKYPDIKFTELRKADHVEYEHFQHLVPQYEVLTARIRKIQGV